MNDVFEIIRAIVRNNVSVEQMGVACTSKDENIGAWLRTLFGENAALRFGTVRQNQKYLYVYEEQLGVCTLPDVFIDVDDTSVMLYEINY